MRSHDIDMLPMRFPNIIRNWGTTAADRISFPDDGQLVAADDVLHRAVTIDAPQDVAWRRLCQLRVAPYSYDWIDNRGRRSPSGLTPGLDQLEIGQEAMTLFHVSGFERPRHVTFSLDEHRWFGRVVVTYVTDAVDPSRTRLRVRLRVRYPRTSPASILMPAILPPGDLVMMRKQLLTLKALAEQDGRLMAGT